MTISDDFSTPAETAMIGGDVALPAGSERECGTDFMPIVTCQLGPYTATWVNAGNGLSGPAILLWDCPEDRARWSVWSVPLVLGANRITVTIRDSVSSTQATVTVTRQ